MIQIDKNIDLGIDRFHEMRKRVKNFKKRQMQDLANAYADPKSKRAQVKDDSKEIDDAQSEATSLLKQNSKSSGFGTFINKVIKSK